MIAKEQLYVKLVIYSLGRSREFILSHYDEKLAEKVTEKEPEIKTMLEFTLQTILPVMELKLSQQTMALCDELMFSVMRLHNVLGEYSFATKEIPIWIKKFENVLKSNH